MSLTIGVAMGRVCECRDLAGASWKALELWLDENSLVDDLTAD